LSPITCWEYNTVINKKGENMPSPLPNQTQPGHTTTAGQTMSSSPKRNMPVMTFDTMLDEIMDGKKVRSKAWLPEDYAVMENDQLKIYKQGFAKGRLDNWIISRGDIEACDWVLI
jgi:hypothetical protein